MGPQDITFVHRVFIGKPVEEVWRALTEKALVDQYYMVPLRELELKAGGAISYGYEEALISGVVKEVEAPIKLAHSFRFTGVDDPESTVAYEIDAVGDEMCLLLISHSGLSDESQTYANVIGGWPMIASALKTLLETGQRLPWPDKE